MTPKDKMDQLFMMLPEDGLEGIERVAVTFGPQDSEARGRAVELALARVNEKFGETLRRLAQ